LGATIRVWDWPTRAVHWLMALLIPFSWWSAENGLIDRHRLSGYTLLGLLLFRFIWGFVGSHASRFASFVRKPATVWRYARGPTQIREIGHNPLGGWSIVAMLLLLALQIGLGLFAVDEDGIESGPLSYLVDFDLGRTIAGLHHDLFRLLAALIALHIATIFWRLLVRRDNLITAMITGRTRVPAAVEEPGMAPGWRAAVAILVSAMMVWLVARGLRF